MNKHKQQSHGFSILIIIALLAVVAVVGIAGYGVVSKSDNQNSGSNDVNRASQSTDIQQDSSEADTIELQNLGLKTFDDILYDQNAVREFKNNGLKGFYVFGDDLPGGRKNPNFEFSSVKSDAQVIAAIDGVVVHIQEQNENGTTDYEVFLQSRDKSVWMIGYDHLINVAVKKGDKVKAGDFLGNPNVQGNGLARFEIQVNKKVNDDVHYCPTSLLAADVKTDVMNNLKTMMNTWESTTGLELYTPESQDPTGCLQGTMTPAEAEGRS